LKKLTLIILGLMQLTLIASSNDSKQITSNFKNNDSSISLEDQKQKVQKLMSMHDPVQTRRNIDIVFNVIDKLLENGNEKESLEYLDFALKHYPWNLKYQIIYAEILKKQGLQEKAIDKAKIVLENSETDDLIERAKNILNIKSFPQISPITPIKKNEHSLILIPMGSFDNWIMYTLKKELESTLNIPVYIQDANIRTPKYRRDGATSLINVLRKKLKKQIHSNEVIEALNESNLSEKDIIKDDNVITIVQCIIKNSEGVKAAIKFTTDINNLRGEYKQWEISDFLQSLEEAVKPFKNKKTYYLGVTKLDCFSDSSNFIFGSAYTGIGLGVVSYCRFTASFNSKSPNKKRLISRTLKQCHSTIGFMLGVNRCSNPTCSRSYPHNLEEHDAKSEKMCDDCQKGFQKFLS